jgi:hypothetical protein
MFTQLFATILSLTLKALSSVETFFCTLFNHSGFASGELLVTGKDEIVLELDKCPCDIRLFFKDDCVMTPCSPKQMDSFNWELCNDGCWCLKISWEVSGARVLVWNVCY